MNKIQKNRCFFSYFFMLIMVIPSLEVDLFGNSTFCNIQQKEYIYSTNFYKEPLKNYFKDIGLSTDESELLTDYYFEYNSMSELTVQWKLIVQFISSEKTFTYKDKEIDYNTIHYDLIRYHAVNDESKKHTIENDITTRIYDYSRNWYTDYYLNQLVNLEISPYQARNFFLAKNIHWQTISDMLEKRINDETQDVRVISVNINHDVGIQFRYKDLDLDMDTIEFTDKYNNDGVLYYKSLRYNNERIYEFRLEMFSDIIFEYLYYIIFVISIIILLAIIIINIKKRV